MIFRVASGDENRRATRMLKQGGRCERSRVNGHHSRGNGVPDNNEDRS
jgi:hypothetical protein